MTEFIIKIYLVCYILCQENLKYGYSKIKAETENKRKSKTQCEFDIKIMEIKFKSYGSSRHHGSLGQAQH